MKILQTIILFLLIYNVSSAQTQFVITGNFPQAPNTEISLKGFTMAGDALLSTTNTNPQGQFTLDYPKSYVGAALLEIKNGKSVILLLNQENFGMQWDDLENFNNLKFTHSTENKAFGDGITVVHNSEGKLAGLKYLMPLYTDELGNDKIKQWFRKEIEVQEGAFPNFVNALPKQSYAAYYLKLRKFLQDIPATASRFPERMPTHEAQFNSMNFLDARLLQSGLFEQLLVSFVTLMESHGDLPEVYKHLNSSTDAFLQSMAPAPELRRLAAEYLFKLFEKRSLFGAAEHLALRMLVDESSALDGRQTALFEQYRKMAIGNIAPSIKFENTASNISELSDVQNTYKLVVFAAGWCPSCVEDIPKLKPFYENWKKKKDLEVVLVSLDNSKVDYELFTTDFPWISSSDFKGWEGPAARDYSVFATPTMYLLDSNNKIVLKPISPEQIDTWLKMVK